MTSDRSRRAGQCHVLRVGVILLVLSAAAGRVDAQRPAAGVAGLAPPPDRTDATDAAVARAAVDEVLQQYRAALNDLDAAAVKRLWPSVSERALSHAFRQLRSQNVTFAECQLTINPAATRAEADCRGSVHYVPRIGEQLAHLQLLRWTFRLWRFDEAWRFEAIDSRRDDR